MHLVITLQQYLDKIGMSQRELSKLTGVRQMTINVMCNNTAQRLDKFHLAKICEVLKCDINDILKLENEVPHDINTRYQKNTGNQAE